MTSVLQLPELTVTHVALYNQARESTCVCGASKTGEVSFCWACRDKIDRVDPSLGWRGQRFARVPFDLSLAFYYDICCDLLRDPQITAYRPARRREADT